MPATVEWYSGLIRSGSEHNKLGDPYDICTVIVREGTPEEPVAHLFGACSWNEAKSTNMKPILSLLKREGWKKARWERIYEDGIRKDVEVKL